GSLQPPGAARRSSCSCPETTCPDHPGRGTKSKRSRLWHPKSIALIKAAYCPGQGATNSLSLAEDSRVCTMISRQVEAVLPEGNRQAEPGHSGWYQRKSRWDRNQSAASSAT